MVDFDKESLRTYRKERFSVEIEQTADKYALNDGWVFRVKMTGNGFQYSVIDFDGIDEFEQFAAVVNEKMEELRKRFD